MSGCAVRDHPPYMPRTFMREGLAFAEAPFGQMETGVKQPPNVTPSQLPPPEQISKTQAPVAQIALMGCFESEDEAIARAKRAGPRLSNATVASGITLDQAIDAT